MSPSRGVNHVGRLSLGPPAFAAREAKTRDPPPPASFRVDVPLH